MVQLYMNIYDITPTETLWDVIDDRKLYKDGRLWFKQDLIDDICKNGIKKKLNVDEKGNIKNGNGRYWSARYLLEKEQDERFRYLPVQSNYAAGAFVKEVMIQKPKKFDELTEENLTQIMNDIISQIAKQWINHTNDPVEPSKTEFIDYIPDPEDDTFLTTHWNQNVNNWAFLSHPNPTNSKTTFIIGIPGPSIGKPRDQLSPEQLEKMDARKRLRLVEMEAKQ